VKSLAPIVANRRPGDPARAGARNPPDFCGVFGLRPRLPCTCANSQITATYRTDPPSNSYPSHRQADRQPLANRPAADAVHPGYASSPRRPPSRRVPLGRLTFIGPTRRGIQLLGQDRLARRWPGRGCAARALHPDAPPHVRREAELGDRREERASAIPADCQGRGRRRRQGMRVRPSAGGAS